MSLMRSSLLLAIQKEKGKSRAPVPFRYPWIQQNSVTHPGQQGMVHLVGPILLTENCLLGEYTPGDCWEAELASPFKIAHVEFRCGAAETNLNRVHEDAGLIPGLA